MSVEVLVLLYIYTLYIIIIIILLYSLFLNEWILKGAIYIYITFERMPHGPCNVIF